MPRQKYVVMTGRDEFIGTRVAVPLIMRNLALRSRADPFLATRLEMDWYNRHIQWYHDMESVPAERGWTTAATGAAAAVAAQSAVNGVLRLTSGTDATGRACVYCGSAGPIVSLLKEPEVEIFFRNVSLGTNQIRIIGFADAFDEAAANPSDGIYLRAEGTGNWYAVTRASSSETTTDLGVVPDTTGWRAFRIRIKESGTVVEFSYQTQPGIVADFSSALAIHTANIPDPATLFLRLGAQVHNNTVASSVGMDIDYIIGQSWRADVRDVP